MMVFVTASGSPPTMAPNGANLAWETYLCGAPGDTCKQLNTERDSARSLPLTQEITLCTISTRNEGGGVGG